ncbi:Myc-type [Macleaya cordata]|uniref:Myc-type n=1 Tax=Macleaya cordata TaxID=56857 RepID=A0A200R8V1_MACCD|nr:Myc-type [Macleaya cordata]
MYPSNHRPSQAGGLTRYVSAPGSFLTSVVDSLIGSDEEFSNVGSETLMGTHHQYFSGDSSSVTTESSCKTNGLPDLKQVYRNEGVGNGSAPTLQRSYGLSQLNVGDFATASNLRCGGGVGGGGGGGGGVGGSSPLTRHSSSPAGFFDHLMVDSAGFSITKGIGGYKSQAGTTTVGHGRLKTQLSFTQDSLSQISEVGESVAGVSSSDEGFTMGSWDDTNAIVFSNPPNKRAKNNNGDISGLRDIEAQSLFNLPNKTSLEIANVEKLLRLQNDSVPCKIRAKRGFATHPRSIAERERRGRISINLRKLEELVPNMDKQTSTADMLELAVQHIKGLQGEIQKLNKDLESCTCGCKQQAR